MMSVYIGKITLRSQGLPEQYLFCIRCHDTDAQHRKCITQSRIDLDKYLLPVKVRFYGNMFNMGGRDPFHPDGLPDAALCRIKDASTL